MPSRPANHSGLGDGASDFEIAVQRFAALCCALTLMLGAGFAVLGSLMSFLRLAVGAERT
jgi:hypothetical protein